MCAIVGSFDINRLYDMIQINAYRGSHSHSLYAFNQDMDIVYNTKGFGSLEMSKLPSLPENCYYISHQQAPTTNSKTFESIHPATYDQKLLWHNGIIKDSDVKRLQKELNTDLTWDTKLLLMYYNKTYNLDNINGSFACVLYDTELFVFRNQISPLFINNKNDISSTKIDDFTSIKSNIVFKFNPFSENALTYSKKFDTFENPYFFIEDD